MTQLFGGMEQFSALLWLFVLTFVIHELEEWNITEFERRNFVGVPETVTTRNARSWIGVICTIAVIWCAAATLPGNPSIAAYVFLPAVALAFGNALQHVFWTFYFRQYAPGLATAVLLVIPLCSYIIAATLQKGHVALWYAAILAAIVLITLYHTVRAGNEMTPLIRSIYGLGNAVAEKL